MAGIDGDRMRRKADVVCPHCGEGIDIVVSVRGEVPKKKAAKARPRKPRGPRMTSVTIYPREEQLDHLNAMADKHGARRSDLIRHGVDLILLAHRAHPRQAEIERSNPALVANLVRRMATTSGSRPPPASPAGGEPGPDPIAALIEAEERAECEEPVPGSVWVCGSCSGTARRRRDVVKEIEDRGTAVCEVCERAKPCLLLPEEVWDSARP